MLKALFNPQNARNLSHFKSEAAIFEVKELRISLPKFLLNELEQSLQKKY